ncbi:hypothetical protein Golomagni_06432 [Golovinomyces magnicellulatus]|nr:hypothetical protein Golomagni_06432 [Golovinomyces magnicellulatus]
MSSAEDTKPQNAEDDSALYEARGSQSGSTTGSFDSTAINAVKSHKGRRKSASGASGADAVKHRRTRSGCFTCRSRRVKVIGPNPTICVPYRLTRSIQCDETRPVCERCRKGNRDCVYPDPPPSKSGPKSKDSRASSGPTTSVSSNDEDENDDGSSKLATILDEDEMTDFAPASAASDLSPRGFFTPNTFTPTIQVFADGPLRDEMTSPTSSQGFNTNPSVHGQVPTATNPADGVLNWSHLPNDFQKYLGYFGARITNYHYLIPCDGDQFFTSILLHFAIGHEPLLNAVAGFAAYHSALQEPNGSLHDFLSYYNKSVTLLLSSLKQKEPFRPETLLTILQLATIEEYLGDWVNLMGHQKAAFEILVKIFTPQTVMHTALGRMCLRWYFRFDNMIALFGGFPTTISRSWISAMVGFFDDQTIQYPHDIRWKIDARQAHFLQLTYDMALLYAKGSRGQATAEEFEAQHKDIENKLQFWKASWDPQLTDGHYTVSDFPSRRPLGADNIVDPYLPGVIYNAPLFNTTVITAEWQAVRIMHKCQKPNMTLEELGDEVSSLTYSICQTIEALQHWHLTPPGTLSSLMQCVSLAALFLPQDKRHKTWSRRKFAQMEQLG